MIVLSNSVPQTIPVGGVATFDLLLDKSGCGECRKHTQSSVKLCKNGIYTVAFSGAISVAAAGGVGQLSIALGGEPLLGSNMVATSTAANELNSVSKFMPIRVSCCDYTRITIKNTGANDVTLAAGPSLAIL